MTGDVADLAAKRDEHEPRPRDGEGFYRHGILTGYAGKGNPPMRHHYPMTSICKCGKTIRRVTPEAEWEHVQW